jgi:hypothetical protein
VALFQQTGVQPTGCGVIHDFVRLFSSGNIPVEQGHNTDARPLQFNENKSPTFTRSLQLSDVPLVTVDGVDYRQFLVGVNQKQSSGSAALLSLDELRIFMGNAPNLTGYDPTSHTLAGLKAAYDLSAQGDGSNYLVINSALTHGNGSGDVFVLIPDAVLTEAASQSGGGTYVYLYSKFGVHDQCNGGFEQWAVQGQGTSSGSGSGSGTGTGTPSASLSGFVTDSNDQPLANVTMTLYDSNGVVLGTATTDASGFYIFSGLSAGTYTLSETVPQDYTATTGTPTQYTTTLAAGTIGLDYNFNDTLSSSSTSTNAPPPVPLS